LEKERLCNSCKNNEPSRELANNKNRGIVRWSGYMLNK